MTGLLNTPSQSTQTPMKRKSPTAGDCVPSSHQQDEETVASLAAEGHPLGNHNLNNDQQAKPMTNPSLPDHEADRKGTNISSPRTKLRDPSNHILVTLSSASKDDVVMSRTHVGSAAVGSRASRVIVGVSSKLYKNSKSDKGSALPILNARSTLKRNTVIAVLDAENDRSTSTNRNMDLNAIIPTSVMTCAPPPIPGMPTMKDFCTKFKVTPKKRTKRNQNNNKNDSEHTGSISNPDIALRNNATKNPVSTSIAPAATPEGGLRVEIINGEIVILQSSLIVGNTHRTIEEVDAEMDSEVVEDGGRTNLTATYASFKEQEPVQQWPVEETRKFYEALRIFGVDFTTMAGREDYFAGKRSRGQLKNKYKTECKRNPRLVDLILRGDVQMQKSSSRMSILKMTDEHTNNQQLYLEAPRSLVTDVSAASTNGSIDENVSVMDKNVESVAFVVDTVAQGLIIRNVSSPESSTTTATTCSLLLNEGYALSADQTRQDNSLLLTSQETGKGFAAVITASDNGGAHINATASGDSDEPSQTKTVTTTNHEIAPLVDVNKIVVPKIANDITSLSLTGQKKTVAKKSNKARIRPVAKKLQRGGPGK